MHARGRKVVEDGITFDSPRERDRYRELKILQRSGEISELQCHPKFRIVWPQTSLEICKYTPDFTYISRQNLLVVEDVKGWRRSKKTGRLLPIVNREFGMKRKLMKANFGIEVIVV